MVLSSPLTSAILVTIHTIEGHAKTRQMEISNSNKFKLVTLGESGVGKSSIILQAVKGQFHEVPMPTIGAAFLNKEVVVESDKEVRVEFDIWDTAGQERFHSILPLYYRGAIDAIVVYDITKGRHY